MSGKVEAEERMHDVENIFGSLYVFLFFFHMIYLYTNYFFRYMLTTRPTIDDDCNASPDNKKVCVFIYIYIYIY